MKHTTNSQIKETTFLMLLKNIFSDILIVLKNFFHWTFARLIIIVLCFLLAVVSFLPFFIVLVILGLIDSIAWGDIFLSFVSGTNQPLLVTAFLTSPFMMILEVSIMLLGVGFSLGVYNYKKVLLYRLIDSYLEKQKISFKKVFTLQFLKRYLKLFPLLFGIFLIPFVIFIIYFFLIIFIFGGFTLVFQIVNASVINPVSILLVLGLFTAFCYGIYIYYKLILVYPLLLRNNELNLQEKHFFKSLLFFMSIIPIIMLVFTTLLMVLFSGTIAFFLSIFNPESFPFIANFIPLTSGWVMNIFTPLINGDTNFLSYIFVLGFLGLVGYFVYLSTVLCKIIFKYSVRKNNDIKIDNTINLLKKSYDIMKGKVLLQLFFVIVIYIIGTQPLGLFSNYAEDTVQNIQLHLQYQEFATFPDNFDFSLISSEFSTKSDFINSVGYVALENVYGSYSVSQLSSRIIRLEVSYRIIALISFFLLYGMYEVVIMSFTRRKLTIFDEAIVKENKVRKLVNAILHPIKSQEHKPVGEL